MMMRRNVVNSSDTEIAAGASSISKAGAPASRGASSGKPRQQPRRSSSSDSSGLSSLVLIILAIFITVATYCFPTEVQNVEQKVEENAKVLAHRAYQAEQDLEKRMLDWSQQNEGQKVPIPAEDHPHFVDGGDGQAVDNYESTQRMLQQDSKWVDGEKKLKAKLKELVERQKKGLDIGVPVLTRWLGDDIPAWPSEGMDVDEWNKKVEAKYEEMRKEEEEWRRRVGEMIAKNRHRG